MTRRPPLLIDGRTVLLKITAADGSPVHGGFGRWPLPTADGPGEWRKVVGELVPCENGLHLIEPAHLVPWLQLGAVVWEAEVNGEILRDSDKLVARKARLVRKVGILDRRTLARFAADCAERVRPRPARPAGSRSAIRRPASRARPLSDRLTQGCSRAPWDPDEDRPLALGAPVRSVRLRRRRDGGLQAP